MYRVHSPLGSVFVRKRLYRQEFRVYSRIRTYHRAHKNVNVVHFISEWSTVTWRSNKYLTLPNFVSVGQDIRQAEGANLKGHTVSLCHQLSRAVHFLHTRLAVAHMDIKPDNLVLDVVDDDKYRSRPTLKVIDFNISILDRAHLSTSGIRGTIGYMAPEVEEGKSYFPFPADRYSCGRTMKELLGVESPDRVNRDLYKAFTLFAAKLCHRNPTLRPRLLPSPIPDSMVWHRRVSKKTAIPTLELPSVWENTESPGEHSGSSLDSLRR